MRLSVILKEQITRLRPTPSDVKSLDEQVKRVCETIEMVLHKKKINADVFVGGSYAKRTLVKKKNYDVDVFLRFDWRYDDISKLAEGVVESVRERLSWNIERVHGSRDYFRLKSPEGVVFELIPVVRIKKAREERNITDLSYFHVKYVRTHARGLEDEIRLAKHFCHAQGVYGAESYIQGFSGYALECLIMHYGGFTRMLKALVGVKDRVIIDIAKHYKNKQDVLFSLNEAKLKSPIILIDPTYKERNALAALSRIQFEKFQKVAKDLLNRPSSRFFEETHIDVASLKDMARKKKAEFVHVQLTTNRQPGDIAGTKLKKFHYFLEREVAHSFNLINHAFDYGGEKTADVYLTLTSKKELVRMGPPLKMKKEVSAFKKAHTRTFSKNGYIHAKTPITLSAAQWVKNFAGTSKTMNEMGVTRLEIIKN